MIIYNGRKIRTRSIDVSPTDRALCYGDGLFETMHWHNGRVLFLKDHMDRLLSGLRLAGIQRPVGWSVSEINKLIAGLVETGFKNRDARLRLQVWRKEGGLYRPSVHASNYLITASVLKAKGYVWNKKGLVVDYCPGIYLPSHPLQNSKTCNSIPYVLAGLYAEKNRLDDCLLLSIKGKLAEATGSNVFMVKDGKVITPPLSDSCIAGIMRKQVIALCKKMKVPLLERSISTGLAAEADELFLTNVITGIRWVARLKKRKLKNETAAYLSDELSRSLDSFSQG